MTTQINTNIVAKAQDLILGQNFHWLTVAWAKRLLFYVLIWAYQCILIIKNKDILTLGEGPAQVLDDTKLSSGTKYHINFTQLGKRFVLSLQFNGINNFLFVNAIKIDEFKANNSEIKIINCV